MKQTFVNTVTIEYKLDIADTVVNDLYCYNLNKNSSDGPCVSFSGFCRSKDLDALKNGHLPSNKWRIVKPEFLDHCKQYGYCGKDGEFEHFYSMVYLTEIYKYFIKNEGVLIRDERDDHMIFDVNSNPLPCAITCNYLDGHYNNSHYKLRLALDILSKRSDIAFPEGAEIIRVPYYNKSKDNEVYIEFVWMPPVDKYIEMWKECKRIGGNYISTNKHQAIFNLDLFGLRAAGAAKTETYYGE